jgi:hypothetical protein
MPIIKSVGPELIQAYDGYDSAKVGAGLLTPDIYATPSYSKKKIKTILMGTLTEISYGGAEHDRTPLMLPFRVEGNYGTLMAFNLHYLPYNARKNLIKFVLESNVARIKSNLPILIDYSSLVRMIPQAKYVVRRYKQVLIGLGADGGSIPLSEWDSAIKVKSKWENHWKDIKDGKAK